MWLRQSEDQQQPIYCDTCSQIMKEEIYIKHWRSCNQSKKQKEQQQQTNQIDQQQQQQEQEEQQEQYQQYEKDEEDVIRCHLCNEIVTIDELNSHSETCKAQIAQCEYCSKQIPISMLDRHQADCRSTIKNIQQQPSRKDIDKGMNMKQIQKIPIMNFIAKDNIDHMCFICQQQFVQSERIMKLSCSHIFHEPCCKEWLMISSFCSICKAPIK